MHNTRYFWCTNSWLSWKMCRKSEQIFSKLINYFAVMWSENWYFENLLGSSIKSGSSKHFELAEIIEYVEGSITKLCKTLFKFNVDLFSVDLIDHLRSPGIPQILFNRKLFHCFDFSSKINHKGDTSTEEV